MSTQTLTVNPTPDAVRSRSVVPATRARRCRLPIVQERVHEDRPVHVYARPVTFSEFLDLFGAKDFVELIDGSVVEMEMVQLDHERLQTWLKVLLHMVCRERDLGIVMGCRTAVEIDEFGGRLPDLLFVRRDRMEIVQRKGVFGAPDLVIEIISPGNRPSNVNSLEVDYRRLGVPEILFIHQKRRYVRILRKSGERYVAQELSAGPLHLESMSGLLLQVEWFFQDPLPDERLIIHKLLDEAG